MYQLRMSERSNYYAQVFNVTDSKIAMVLLPQPIVATTLRFRILDHFLVSNEPCWTLALLGCTFSEGIYIRMHFQ